MENSDGCEFKPQTKEAFFDQILKAVRAVDRVMLEQTLISHTLVLSPQEWGELIRKCFDICVFELNEILETPLDWYHEFCNAFFRYGCPNETLDEEILLAALQPWIHLARMQNLIQKNAMSSNDLQVYFQMSICANFTQSMVYLLSKGANPKGRCSKGISYLEHALREGNQEAYELLIRAGAGIFEDF